MGLNTPRAWFIKLKMTLVNWDFQHSRANPSLFFLHTNGKILYILIYVDDVLVTSNNVEYLKNFISDLSKNFSVKDIGMLHYFLGIQVRRTAKGFFLNQEQYITDLLVRFDMQKSAPCPTPFCSRHWLL